MKNGKLSKSIVLQRKHSPLTGILFFAILATITTIRAQPPEAPGNWNLVWNDEFEGSELDYTKWEAAPEWARQGGSYWEADNHSLDGAGMLRLDVTEINDTVYCGAIRTHSLYEKKFGYFEVKSSVPQIHGGWAAFWLMPYNMVDGGDGKDGTEIDIFESINGWNNSLNQALHWGGYGAGHQSSSHTEENRTDIYDGNQHTFGVWWKPDEYIFYVDGVETWRTSDGGVSQVEQYIKLTLEVSGESWPGNWADQLEKPIYWYVDYVRVYENDSISTSSNNPFAFSKIEPHEKINIYTINGKHIKTLKGTSQNYLWDKTDSNNRLAKPGVYVMMPFMRKVSVIR